jgi:tRNA1Val (adenine37-N6)-methyltransferase
MSVFRFKQFNVAQDKCGMKISSVACVFAALIAPQKFTSLLDIGTGTGVLSLMIAQKNGAEIVAIEMDIAAATQAKENFANSKWHFRMTVEQANVIDWAEQSEMKFDCLICNPPFFKKQQQSVDLQRNMARHSEILDAHALAKISTKLLHTEGKAHFLIANGYETAYKAEFQAQGFCLLEHTEVFAHPNKNTAFCHILSFGKKHNDLITNCFYIQNEHLEMHSAYKELMRDYLIIFE